MNQINESDHTGLSTDPAAVLLLELAGGLEPPESQRTGPEFGNFVYLIHLTSGSCSFFQCHLLAHLLCARCYAGTPSVCKVLTLGPTPSTTRQPGVTSPSGTNSGLLSGSLQDSCACLQQHSGPGLRPVTWSRLSGKHTQYANTNVGRGFSLANQQNRWLLAGCWAEMGKSSTEML